MKRIRRKKVSPYRCRDHKGEVYDSITEMAHHYGITCGRFCARRKAGYSLEACLTGIGVRSTRKTCTDHKGNVFVSEHEMCHYYGIKPNIYRSRIQSGYSIKDALTTPVKDIPYVGPKTSTDHKGNIFVSEKEMCRHYGIDRSTFKQRRLRGMSIEESLTMPAEAPIHIPAKPCVDHLGQHFASVKAMCRHYGINSTTYRARIRNGYGIEQALTNAPYSTNGEQDSNGTNTPIPEMKAEDAFPEAGSFENETTEEPTTKRRPGRPKGNKVEE